MKEESRRRPRFTTRRFGADDRLSMEDDRSDMKGKNPKSQETRTDRTTITLFIPEAFEDEDV